MKVKRYFPDENDYVETKTKIDKKPNLQKYIEKFTQVNNLTKTPFLINGKVVML